MGKCYGRFFLKNSKIGRENAILSFVFLGGEKGEKSESHTIEICKNG
jgi:hypothetical protein